MSQLRGAQLPAGGVPGEDSAYLSVVSRVDWSRYKVILPPSLKMILKTYRHRPVRCPAPKTLMQPDDVIGGHWAGENSPQSHCDPSPLRAAVDTGSEKPGTPPRSPAIGTGPGLGVSRAETQMEEE